jgi:hypothetical protein
LGDQKVHLQQAEKRTRQLSQLEDEALAHQLQQNQLLNDAEKALAVTANELLNCLTLLPEVFQ